MDFCHLSLIQHKSAVANELDGSRGQVGFLFFSEKLVSFCCLYWITLNYKLLVLITKRNKDGYEVYYREQNHRAFCNMFCFHIIRL